MDRRGQARRLKAHGADRTAIDAGELARVLRTPCRTTADLPSALNRWEDLAQALAGQTPVIFLDYDGTLTPIVERPEQAVLSEAMADTLTHLADRCTVTVISGRDLKDVRNRVGIDSIYYAGSHGFEIAGPRRKRIKTEKGLDALPILDTAEDRLRNMLKDISGAEVERKRFSIAVHYRRVADDKTAAVQQAVDDVLASHSGLRQGHGKKVIELQPDVDWDKGKAVERLLEILSLDTAEAVLPIYIGDDVTDEDAFQALRGHGIGIVVHTGDPKPTHARYRLADPFRVRQFLGRLVEALEKGSR
jgi:alpha,alpha-trehalase